MTLLQQTLAANDADEEENLPGSGGPGASRKKGILDTLYPLHLFFSLYRSLSLFFSISFYSEYPSDPFFTYLYLYHDGFLSFSLSPPLFLYYCMSLYGHYHY